MTCSLRGLSKTWRERCHRREDHGHGLRDHDLRRHHGRHGDRHGRDHRVHHDHHDPRPHHGHGSRHDRRGSYQRPRGNRRRGCCWSEQPLGQVPWCPRTRLQRCRRRYRRPSCWWFVAETPRQAQQQGCRPPRWAWERPRSCPQCSPSQRRWLNPSSRLQRCPRSGWQQCQSPR